MSPWHRRCGQPWPDEDNFAFGQWVHFRKPLPYKMDEKFAPPGSQGVFVGWFLLPDGVYKGDMLIVDLGELATAPLGSKPRVYRIKEARVPEIGTAFPLRVAHLEARQRMLADTVDFIDDPEAPEEIRGGRLGGRRGCGGRRRQSGPGPHPERLAGLHSACWTVLCPRFPC